MMRKSILYKIGRNLINCLVPNKFIPVPIFFGRGKGLKMFLNLHIHKSYCFGFHEKPVQKCFKRLVHKNSVIYDVGANIGFFSLISSKLSGPKGIVFAFEPVPENYRYLIKNKQLNKMQNIHPVKKAVAEKSGIDIFSREPTFAMGHIQEESKVTSSKIIVSTVSIDDFIFNQKHIEPDLIKMDIEGGELQAIMGARRTLREICPVFILEIHGPEKSKIVGKELKNAGYTFFNLENQEIKILPDFGHAIARKINF